MHDVDETDVRILQLLAEDGRRPYSEIAERVELSPPAVSDRVDRLREEGIIRRFTVDVDRTTLREATPVLLAVEVRPTAVDRVRSALVDSPAVERVYTTDGATVVCHANAPTPVRGWLLSTVDPDHVEDYTVDAVESVDQRVTVTDEEFGVTCTECGDRVTGEGITAGVNGDVRHFCGPACESRHGDELAEAEAADS